MSDNVSDGIGFPRVLSMAGLVAITLGLAQCGWVYVDSVALLAWASGLASSFGSMAATLVWAMRDKSSQLTALHESSDSSTYARAIGLERIFKKRSFELTCTVLVAILFMSLPMLSNQLLGGAIWHYMVLLFGLGIGWCVCAIWIAHSWDEQMQAYKSKRILEIKQQQEQNALIERIEKSGYPSSSTGLGWSMSGDTLEPHH
jgi:hypothetical protein